MLELCSYFEKIPTLNSDAKLQFSCSATQNTAVVKNKISEEEKATLQQRLKEFETTITGTPEDQAALELSEDNVGTNFLKLGGCKLTELGEYSRAVALLQKLAKERPTDPDVFRLLGEVNYELQNYEGSIAAYRISEKAVKFLLDTRERLNTRKTSTADSVTADTKQNLDPLQVELLLGKAYSDWGHVSDAIAVYDRLITDHPEDFRGYLAKGILLKENGSRGDAERMFIQARFFAPDKAKAFVDRYSKQ